MERVGITGATGYLGSALVAALERGGTRPHRADIREADCWTRLVDRADTIFHLAGNTSAAHADRNPDDSYRSTVAPVNQLISAAQALRRTPRVVFASTATIYGLTDRTPVDEDVEARPLTTYDRHKLEAEQRLLDASSAGIIDAVVLRLSNVYGPSPAASGARDRGFLNRAVAAAMHGEELMVYGDGTYVRDFVYVDDAVRAFAAAGDTRSLSSRCFNVGSGVGVTMRDALTLVSETASRLCGRPVQVCSVPWPIDAHAIERRSYIADVRRISGEMNWRPAVALHGGIEQLALRCMPVAEQRLR